MKMRSADYGLRICILLTLVLSCGSLSLGQIPEPGPARSVSIPAVKESKLKNGLTVAVVEKRSVPIVTVQLVVKNGAASEGIKKAGLADMTASMLTKGTKTRTAEQIAEEMEFLGASISSGAGWNSSSVTIGVTSDKLEQAMAIMADVVLNPAFAQTELDLLKSQTLDELKYNLTQPAFLANYAASVYSFGEHPASGTAASVESISRTDIVGFHNLKYAPQHSILIFAGDIDAAEANRLATRLFQAWPQTNPPVSATGRIKTGSASEAKALVKRIVVLDLAGAGQASVNFYAPIHSVGRAGNEYYSASVLNSLLGGGYSSRLNQEIRIKRGLSYGAGSSFGWRGQNVNFSTRTQTKNESAAEVAELVLGEVKRLAATDAAETELNPRRLVLTGGFGQNLETTRGLASALADLYSFGIPAAELNKYMAKVTAVTPASVKDFASKHLYNGDLIIVGDYAVFKDDLAKRFPNMKIDVLKVEELNIESPTLRRSDVP